MYGVFEFGATKLFVSYIFLAPLLLLKTKASIRRGLRVGHWIVRILTPIIDESWKRVEQSKTPLAFGAFQLLHALLCLPIFSLLALATPLIKVYSTFKEWPRNFLLPLRRLPKNWTSICLQTDLTQLPELLPGSTEMANTHNLVIETTSALSVLWEKSHSRNNWHENSFSTFLRLNRDNGVMFSLSAMLGGLKNSRLSFFGKLWASALMSTAILGILVFGFAYRWALKATALFWIPIIYFSHSIFRKRDKLERRIDEIIDSPISFIQRGWALAIFLVHLIMPWICWRCFVDAARWVALEAPEIRPLFSYFFVVESGSFGHDIKPWHISIKSWHLAGIFGGIVTWLLWKMAKDYRLELVYDLIKPVEKYGALRKIQMLQCVRAICMTWVIICGFVPAGETFKKANWSIKVIGFPSVSTK